VFYSLRHIFRSRATGTAVKIKIYKIMLNQSQCMAVKHELWLKGMSGYMGKENIKKDTWTGGRARNMVNKN